MDAQGNNTARKCNAAVLQLGELLIAANNWYTYVQVIVHTQQLEKQGEPRTCCKETLVCTHMRPHLGLKNTFSVDTIATTCMASTEHPIVADASNTLPYMGSTGRRASCTPLGLVRLPEVSSAPRAYRSSKDLFDNTRCYLMWIVCLAGLCCCRITYTRVVTDRGLYGSWSIACVVSVL